MTDTGSGMDDDELERVMRSGLQRRAEQTTVDGVDVAERARGDVRRRRGGLALASFAAAAVVVAGIVVVGVARDGGPVQQDVAGTGPSGTETATSLPEGPTRTEYWHGVQVEVPRGWGWAPTPGACGAPPEGRPYVGRPISDTDACSVLDPDAVPTAPYLWFDADGVEAGTVDLDGGWVRETVQLAGTRVSVATRDDGLRERVLGSLAPGELCAPRRTEAPTPRYDVTVEGTGRFLGGEVSAYRTAATGLDLVWGQRLGAAVAAETEEAAFRAPETPPCLSRSGFELVVVTARYADDFGAADLSRDFVYDPFCATVTLVVAPFEPRIVTHRMTEPTVPWAGEAFRHVLTGPSADWSYRRFIGIQG